VSLSVTPSVATPSRRATRRGWRPLFEGDFPTLGRLALQWTHAYLPSPANEKQPFVYTDEQVRRIFEWFRLDPRTGAFVHGRRLHLQEAKGFGKSPFAASLDLLDFAGPVCFDNWDADGQPVGVPWGTGERPAPWIQVAAVSEAQTRNTYSAIYAMLVANDHRAARDLGIDDGRTRLYLRDVPDAILEPVTASAGSREGQRVTKATLDEPQLWFPGNGGHKLADTILGNLTKMGGRAVFTGNAYVKDEESVAERFDSDEPGVLRFARQPTEDPQQNWPRARLIAGLREVYADAERWVGLERIVDDAVSPTADWERMKRLFWNIPSTGAANRWMQTALWESCEADVRFNPTLPVYAALALGHDHRTAAVAIAQRQSEAVALRVRHFPEEPLDEGDYLPVGELERHLRSLAKRYPARILAPKVFSPRGREHLLPAPGPEVAYHGSFFEGSAQRLQNEGIVMVDVPLSQERLIPAAETLMRLATEGALQQDGDAELAREMGLVRAKPAAKGWSLEAPSEDRQRPVAALAAMVAVHRAMTAPRPPARTMRYGVPK
jgi:hypothetical protein